MKTGLTLTQMAVELERRQNAKRDFVADTRQLAVIDGGAGVTLQLNAGPVTLGANDLFRRQLNTHYRIPQDYADRVRQDHPMLYDTTVNTFLARTPARRMVRTLDSAARAFLSDRFRPLDDFDLMNGAVLPAVMGLPDIRVESCQFTEERLYFKAVFPRIQTEVRKGDVVQIGLVVSNSEVGSGALSVAPLIYRLVCLNGMISDFGRQRQYHVGKRADTELDAFELYSDATKQLDNAAFFAKVRDTVKGVLTREVLEKITQRLRDATEQKIETASLQAAVEVTAARFGYGEAMTQGILRHLIEGGDLTKYGLANAITAQSQTEESYETATQLERDGGSVIELSRTDWKAIGEAELKKAA